jgi:hypothetical protein
MCVHFGQDGDEDGWLYVKPEDTRYNNKENIFIN